MKYDRKKVPQPLPAASGQQTGRDGGAPSAARLSPGGQVFPGGPRQNVSLCDELDAFAMLLISAVGVWTFRSDFSVPFI